MDLFLGEVTDQIGADDDAMAKINALMNWALFSSIRKRGLGRSGDGPAGYYLRILFSCLLFWRWHDPKFERGLKGRRLR